jgi:hypothetical protein
MKIMSTLSATMTSTSENPRFLFMPVEYRRRRRWRRRRDTPMTGTARHRGIIVSMSTYHSTVLLGFTGHMNSGKDTVAGLVMSGMSGESKHLSFAGPLRDEINRVIGIIRDAPDRSEALQRVYDEMTDHKEIRAARLAFDAIYDDVRSGRVTSSYDRTDSMRTALQEWGTDLRRAKDSDYWVRKTGEAIDAELRHNVSVFVTDARFPNEIEEIRAKGGLIIRLDVDESTQIARSLVRDGIRPTVEELHHPSETAADQCRFDVRYDTTRFTARAIAASVIALVNHDNRQPGENGQACQ